MQRQTETLTYKRNMSKDELFRIMKAIGLPLMVFALELFTINNFGAFGTKLICPFSGAMWAVGVVVAFLMPSQRHETLNQTLIVCSIYCLALLGFKIVLGVVSGVSSEMIAASYDQALPTSSGNTIPGYLQTMLWITAVMLPLGNIGMQGKRLFNFRRARSLERTYDIERDIRSAGKEHMRSH